MSKNLENTINNKYKISVQNFRSNIRILNSNSISSNLKKGYSILMKKDKIIKSIKDIRATNELKAKINDGSLELKVKKIN